MSTRHQSRRRRSYGRRDHEVRERRQREESSARGYRVADESIDDDSDVLLGVPVHRGLHVIVPVVRAASASRRLDAA